MKKMSSGEEWRKEERIEQGSNNDVVLQQQMAPPFIAYTATAC